MSKVTPSKVSWNSGIIVDLLSGRVDLDQYKAGCFELQNGIPMLQGPAMKRPGSIYVSNTKGNIAVWLSEFKYSNTQQYILAWGDSNLRFFTQDGFVETFPGSGVPYEIATPYATSVLTNEDGGFAINFEQSADVIYLFHPSIAPQVLTRVANNNWTIAALAIVGGPFEDKNTTATTVTASAGTGAITLTASSAIFAATDVGALFLIEKPIIDITPQWVSGTVVAAGDYCISNNKHYYAINAATSGTVAPNHTVGILYDGKNTGVKWQYIDAGFGYAKITGFTSTTVVNATVLSIIPIQAVGVPTTVWAFGELRLTNGWPTHGGFYRDRLTLLRNNKLFQSVTGLYADFSDRDANGLIVTDRAIKGAIQGSQINTVKWTAGLDTFLIGTAGAEYSLGPSNQNSPYGPQNSKLVRRSSHGSRNVRPPQVGDQIFTVHRSGSRVREVSETDQYGYKNEDLSKLVAGITSSTIIQMTYTEEPWFCVWLLLSNGTLLALTYDKNDNIAGWHRHSLGASTGETALIESIATITNATGTRDELWMAVNRAGVRTIEFLAPPLIGSNIAQDSVHYVDCGASYSGAPATVISGLSYLNGKTVAVLADGGTHPDRTVSGGQITLAAPASKVKVGFRYKFTMITNRFEGGGNYGSSQGLVKHISKLVMRVVGSLGGYFGLYVPSGTNLVQEINYRTPAMRMDLAPTLYTGDIILPFPGGSDTDARIIITQDDPLPFTISLITPIAEVFESD